MGMKIGKQGDVTIVGGRPMHRAVETKDLPQGVEQVLTLAGLDPGFREAVAVDPVAAALGKGINLDPVEAALLQSMPPADIAAMSERLIIPKNPERRSFIKAVSASVVAMVTGNAFMLCSGCTGADTFENEAGQQQWMTLAGYTCYVCTPPQGQDASGAPLPVLIALHDEGETCLSSAQRWQGAADAWGVCVVAINWTQDAPEPAQREALIENLKAILTELNEVQPLNAGDVCLSAKGAAAHMLFQAAVLGLSPVEFRAVNMLGGAPDGDWTANAEALLADAVSDVPSVYFVLGKQDDDYDQGSAFANALLDRSVPVRIQEVDGSTGEAVLSFDEILGWMRR